MSKEVWWKDENGKAIHFDTISEFCEAYGITYKTGLEWIRVGYDAVANRQVNGRSRKPLVLSPLPKPVKVNQNCIVRVHHEELDKLLNYLAKTCKTTYQAAFEQFIIYIYEGHLWAQDSVQVLKSRLNGGYEPSENGHVVNYEDSQQVAPHLRIAELLESHIVSLETENAELKAWKDTMLKRLKDITEV